MQKAVHTSDRPIFLHVQDYRHNYRKSQFAKHLLEENHPLDPIEKTMSTLHSIKKGKMLNTAEKFYIHKETNTGNQLNDKSTIASNKIFDTILRYMTSLTTLQ
jgi:hypothetical protein